MRTNLAGNASRDDDNVGALEGLVELVSSVALDLSERRECVCEKGRLKHWFANQRDRREEKKE